MLTAQSSSPAVATTREPAASVSAAAAVPVSIAILAGMRHLSGRQYGAHLKEQQEHRGIYDSRPNTGCERECGEKPHQGEYPQSVHGSVLPRTVYAINRSMAFMIALRSSEDSEDITASRDSSIAARSGGDNLDIA